MQLAPAMSVLLALAPLASSQNDECAQAIDVTVGTYAFDTALATPSAPSWTCAAGGGPDLWYRFTARSTGIVSVTTCVGAGYDSALQVFRGTCAALVPLGCNDDWCGLQSRVQFAATAGQAYYIRVAGWNNLTGSGTFSVYDGTPILDVTTGSYYATVSAPGITWTQARSDAALAMHNGRRGRLVTLNDQQESDLVFQRLGGADECWAGGFQDLASPTFSEPGGGWTWITSEPLGFTQWLPGEPNNAGALGGQDFLMLRQSGPFGAYWQDAADLDQAAGYVIEFEYTGVGTTYCAANINSTGVPAAMSATGNTSVALNDLTLRCSAMPSNVLAYFLTSVTAGFIPNPGGSEGNLCLGGTIGRYVGPGQVLNSGAAGEVALVLDLTAHPTSTGLVAVQIGETWRFTCWFRDGAGGVTASNFADGLAVTFD